MTPRRALAIATLVLALSACGGTSEPEPCTDPVPLTTVRLEDFSFRPDCLTAPAGATIRLENDGDAPHTFTIEGTDVDFDLRSGESVATTIAGVDPGLYAVTCTYHPQMTATLRIGAPDQ